MIHTNSINSQMQTLSISEQSINIKEKNYNFQETYTDEYLISVFKEIFEYLKIIESSSTKKLKTFHSLKCVKYHYNQCNKKINKYNYCIEAKEELTGIVLLYYLRTYNFVNNDIITDFINNIDRKLKFDHDQEDFSLSNYKRKYTGDVSEKWLKDSRWADYTYSMASLLETIYIFQEMDTIIITDKIGVSTTNNKSVSFGQREHVYTGPLIGSSLLFVDSYPSDNFDEYFNINDINTHIIKMTDIVVK